MLQGEHSAIHLTFIKLPFVIKISVLSIFELSFYTDFTVLDIIRPAHEIVVLIAYAQNVLLNTRRSYRSDI